MRTVPLTTHKTELTRHGSFINQLRRPTERPAIVRPLPTSTLRRDAYAEVLLCLQPVRGVLQICGERLESATAHGLNEDIANLQRVPVPVIGKQGRLSAQTFGALVRIAGDITWNR